MSSDKQKFWPSFATIISVFLIIGIVEAFFIYFDVGEILVSSGVIAARFMIRTYVIYLGVGVLAYFLARMLFALLGKFRPFRGEDALISILSISVALVCSAYLFEYILQYVLGNPLTRKDIVSLFLLGIFLSWLIFSWMGQWIFGFVFRDRRLKSLLIRLGTPAFHVGIVALYIVAGGLMAAGSEGHAEVVDTERPNVWLISVDTLRQDRLSVYGYDKMETPHMDRLAADGVLFENAFSPDHWTLPAHASLFTSLSPDVHGVNERANNGFLAVIPEALPTLAERMSDHGYMTVGAVDNDRMGYLGAMRNFDQGFDYYGHYPIVVSPAQRLLFPRVFNWLRRPIENEHSSSMISSIISWLGDEPRRPYFFFLHLYDVHAEFDNRVQLKRFPYFPFQPCAEESIPDWASVEPPTLNGKQGEAYMDEVNTLSDPRKNPQAASYEGPSARELEILSSLYDCGVSWVDSQLGRLFEHMREHDLYDNSIIILTSDHGEEFYEHRRLGHWAMYDELLRVPLIIKTAHARELNKRVSDPVSLLDVAPTILDLVDSRGIAMAEGASLVSVLSGGEGDREGALSDRGIVSGSLNAHGHASLHYGHYKFVQHIYGQNDTAQELYDIEKDRLETTDLSGTEVEILADYSAMLDAEIRLQRELRAMVESMGLGTEDGRVKFTDLMKDDLEALGYVE